MNIPFRNYRDNTWTGELSKEFEFHLSNSNELTIVSPFIGIGIVKLIKKNLNKINKIKVMFSVGDSDNSRPGLMRSFVSELLTIENPEKVQLFVHTGKNKDQSQKTHKLHSKYFYFVGEEKNVFASGSSNFSFNGLYKNEENLIFQTIDKNEKSIDLILDDIFNSIEVIEFEEWIKDPINNDMFNKIEDSTELQYFNNQVQVREPNFAQIEILERMQHSWNDGYKSGIVVAATGIGKTFLGIFDFFTQIENSKNNGEVPFKTLLFHTPGVATIRDAFNNSIEYLTNKEFKVYSRIDFELLIDNEIQLPEKYIVFTNSSILSNNLNSFGRKQFDYIVFDEVHHTNENEFGIMQSILSYFEPKRKLGITATLDRMDDFNVSSFFEDNVIFNFGIIKSIASASISPFRFNVRAGIEIEKGISIKDVSDARSTYINQVYSKESLSQRVTNLYNLLKNEIYKRTNENNQKLRSIAFVESIKVAETMSQELNKIVRADKQWIEEYGKNSTDISIPFTTYAGTGSNFELSNDGSFKVFSRLVNKHDSLQIIFAVDRLNEGVDIPSINHVFLFRRTNSDRIFTQQIGRGLRLDREYKNKVLEIYDFIDMFEDIKNYEKVKRSSNLLRVTSMLNSSAADHFAMARQMENNLPITSLEVGLIGITFDDKSNDIIKYQLTETGKYQNGLLANDRIDKNDIQIVEAKSHFAYNWPNISLQKLLSTFTEFNIWDKFRNTFKEMDVFPFLNCDTLNDDEHINGLVFPILNFILYGPLSVVKKLKELVLNLEKFDLLDFNSDYLLFEFQMYLKPFYDKKGNKTSNKVTNRAKYEKEFVLEHESQNKIKKAISKIFDRLSLDVNDLFELLLKWRPNDFTFNKFTSVNIAAMFNRAFNSTFDRQSGEVENGKSVIYMSTLFNAKNAEEFIAADEIKYSNEIINDKLFLLKNKHSIKSKKNFDSFNKLEVFLRSWYGLRASKIEKSKQEKYKELTKLNDQDSRYLYIASVNRNNDEFKDSRIEKGYAMGFEVEVDWAKAKNRNIDLSKFY